MGGPSDGAWSVVELVATFDTATVAKLQPRSSRRAGQHGLKPSRKSLSEFAAELSAQLANISKTPPSSSLISAYFLLSPAELFLYYAFYFNPLNPSTHRND